MWAGSDSNESTGSIDLRHQVVYTPKKEVHDRYKGDFTGSCLSCLSWRPSFAFCPFKLSPLSVGRRSQARFEQRRASWRTAYLCKRRSISFKSGSMETLLVYPPDSTVHIYTTEEHAGWIQLCLMEWKEGERSQETGAKQRGRGMVLGWEWRGNGHI